MNKLIIVILILAISASLLNGQEYTISQFDSNPMLVNPGMTGDFEGRLRLNVNFRNQWDNLPSNFDSESYLLSADSHLSLRENLELGVGLFGAYEVGGSLNFTVQSYQVSTALHYYIGEKSNHHHKLSLGMSGGLGSQFLDSGSDGQIWSSEHDGNGGNTGISPPMVLIENYSINYPLLSTGFMWLYQSASRFSAKAGVAGYGVNRPNIAFDDNEKELNIIKWSMLGQVELPIGSHFSVSPSLYYVKRASLDQLTFGTFGRFYTSGESNQRFVQVGIFGRTVRNPELEVFFNSIISSQVRIQLDWISVGYAFDRNRLIGAGITGYTHEFSLGYRIGSKDK